MTWDSLRAVRLCTALEGKRSKLIHHFVRLPSGRWTRTLGPPKGCKPLGPRTWAVVHG